MDAGGFFYVHEIGKDGTHCFISRSSKLKYIHAATAFALTLSIACRMPAQTDRSVNTSTMLP